MTKTYAFLKKGALLHPCLVLSWGARLPGTTARLAVRCRSLTARGTSNLPTQPPKGRGREEARSDPQRGFTDQRWVDIVTSPSPSVVRGRFGSFKPSRAQPIGDLTQKVRTGEVPLDLSPSLPPSLPFTLRGPPRGLLCCFEREKKEIEMTQNSILPLSGIEPAPVRCLNPSVRRSTD